jgi:ubiquinone/menaquinone biosynthesis C-methylase UbiE
MNMKQEDVIKYYASFGEREWQRLEESSIGTIEFAVTIQKLKTYLPETGHILDLGGGPGRYTIWLAQQGYRVTLADISADMLDLARGKIKESGVEDNVEAIIKADARDLSSWSDATFDAVLALGPFYHLPEKKDRQLATMEILRVLQPHGLAFIALMPKLAFLRRALYLTDERHHLLNGAWRQNLLERGTFENDIPGRFTYGFGVEVSQVKPAFERFGFETIGLFSLESFTAGLETILTEIYQDDPGLYQEVIELIIEYAEDPSLLGMALHILYVGQKTTA